MKFEKHTVGDCNYYFSGIYKISQYHWDADSRVNKTNYKAYYLPVGNRNWGDYVGGKPAQQNKILTLAECKKLCEEHAKTYEPTKKQLEQAEIAKQRWIGYGEVK